MKYALNVTPHSIILSHRSLLGLIYGGISLDSHGDSTSLCSVEAESEGKKSFLLFVFIESCSDMFSSVRDSNYRDGRCVRDTRHNFLRVLFLAEY